MIELILTVIFLGSLIALGTMLYKKIPDLVKLSDTPTNWRTDIMPKMKKGIEKLPGAKTLNYELYLQKVLSRIRILTMRTENKTSHWLEKLRQRNHQKNNRKPDSYWDELKKPM